MKQSDRFTITASNAYQRNHVNDETCGEVWIKETSAMLRLQHAAYVKMVRREMKAMGEPREMATFEHGRKAGLTWVLAAMARYRKGTR